MTRPIGDNDLLYAENNAANASGIITRCKALAYQIDDPETLQIVLEVLMRAQSIRKATIEWSTTKRSNHESAT